MNSNRILKGYSIPRAATILALIVLSVSSLATLRAQGQSYGLKYDLAYSGIPFPGGVISVASNFTNTGQLTVRVTSISLASDFWSNGTRLVTSGFPINLTVGAIKMIDTPVLIPTSAAVGNHDIRATATWQYSNSSGMYAASPIVASLTVAVSQTLDALFSSYATILLVGFGVPGVVVVLAVLLVIRRRNKRKPSFPFQGPKPN